MAEQEKDTEREREERSCPVAALPLRPAVRPREAVRPPRQAAPQRSAGTGPLWRQTLGEVLRERRLERGDRLRDVAERAGVALSHLSKIERGDSDPSSEVLEAVSTALEMSPLELAERIAGSLRGRRGTAPLLRAA